MNSTVESDDENGALTIPNSFWCKTSNRTRHYRYTDYVCIENGMLKCSFATNICSNELDTKMPKTLYVCILYNVYV